MSPTTSASSISSWNTAQTANSSITFATTEDLTRLFASEFSQNSCQLSSISIHAISHIAISNQKTFFSMKISIQKLPTSDFATSPSNTNFYQLHADPLFTLLQKSSQTKNTTEKQVMSGLSVLFCTQWQQADSRGKTQTKYACSKRLRERNTSSQCLSFHRSPLCYNKC